MIIRHTTYLLTPLVCASLYLHATSLAEQFAQAGYVEICDQGHGAAAFDALYACFDEFIAFLHRHPAWAHKLYCAKERFIRSKDKNIYATDFFGFYDESTRASRSQISFYYSIHFHEFLCARYPEFNQIPAIARFLDACLEVQRPYGDICAGAATALGLEVIFAATHGQPPILLKVVKYLPAYTPARPHYDGTAFSLFLDSTDTQSLLLAPYRSLFTVDDFSSPFKRFPRGYEHHSVLLIPGTLLTEFSIYPTPHIVVQSGAVRYATVAFAMRPHYIAQRNEFSALPSFQHFDATT